MSDQAMSDEATSGEAVSDEATGRLARKIALITGGGSGIGRETAFRFAREGATVVVADVQDEAGQATVRDIEEAGGRASFVHADVSKAVSYTHLRAHETDSYL